MNDSLDLGPTSYKDQIESLVLPSKTAKVIRKELTCETCHSYLEIYNGHYLCPECGACEDIFCEEDTALCNYNTDPNASSPLKIVGRDSSAHQRHHIQKTSDYNKKRSIDSQTEFNRLLCLNSSRVEKPPPIIYEKASELFNKIQNGQVNRSDRRVGIQIACIYFEARRAGMVKDRNLMARLHDIEPKVLNRGIDDLERLSAISKIEIPVFDDDDEQSFIDQNFKKYQIDKKYIPFVEAFIQRATLKHVSQNSGPNPKCIGTIYLLAKLLDMNDVLERLSKECGISKPTYTRFYSNVLIEHKVFQKVYGQFKDLHPKLRWSEAKKLQ